jgi:hypothetical protein
MGINTFFGFLSPLIFVFIGIMLKFSHNDGWNKFSHTDVWSTYKKYWLYFIIGGLLLLIFKICKY